jgi:hypothetical protein
MIMRFAQVRTGPDLEISSAACRRTVSFEGAALVQISPGSEFRSVVK